MDVIVISVPSSARIGSRDSRAPCSARTRQPLGSIVNASLDEIELKMVRAYGEVGNGAQFPFW